MLYAIVLIGGVIAGFLVPPSKRSFGVLLVVGVFFLTGVSVAAALSSYDMATMTHLLSLRDNPRVDELGLIQLTGVAYGCMISGVVAGVRALSARPRRN